MKGMRQTRQNNCEPNRPFHVAEPCRPYLSAGTQTCHGPYAPSPPSLAPFPARHLPQPFHIGKHILPLLLPHLLVVWTYARKPLVVWCRRSRRGRLFPPPRCVSRLHRRSPPRLRTASRRRAHHGPLVVVRPRRHQRRTRTRVAHHEGRPSEASYSAPSQATANISPPPWR